MLTEKSSIGTGASEKRNRFTAITSRLFGNPETASLENRVFNTLFFLSFLVGIGVTVSDRILNVPSIQAISSVSTILIGFTAYFLSRKTGNCQPLVVPFTISLLFMLAFYWFTAAGSNGPTPLLFFILSAGMVILWVRKFKVLALVIIMLMIIGLNVIEFVRPGLAIHYPDPLLRQIDVLISTIVAIFINGLMFYVVMTEYQAERRKVEKTVAEKQRLLSIVSHDIANALTIIEGNTFLLDMKLKGADDDQRKSLAALKFAGTNIHEIISSVRMVQAIESGKTSFEPEPVEVSSLLKKVSTLFEARFLEKRVTLTIDNRLKREEYVLADANTLSNNVLANLVSNALKFSYPGATVRVTAESLGSETLISVADSGKGVPRDLQRSIFSPVGRTSRPGTANEPGTGFGMAVVKSFVDLYGGRIAIESRPEEEFSDNHGTTIMLYLKSHTRQT